MLKMNPRFRQLAVQAALCLLLAASGCTKKTADNFQGKDRDMVEAAGKISLAINAYHSDTAEWPLSIRDAAEKLPPGTSWPVNPYNGNEIADTGSADFDPASSVGNVFYEKFEREGQIMNYRLHIFGDKGKLTLIGNTAFGAE